MIPLDFITEWRSMAPWIRDSQVEQDLILCRALVEIFNVPEAAEALASRGGTALYKLLLTPPARYSEDIDLVQIAAGPIGGVLEVSIKTCHFDELLGTKLRALYQRKKSRDLFDLWTAHRDAGSDPERVVACFLRYLDEGELRISRAEFEANLAAKLVDGMFTRDIKPLLAPRATWDIEEAARYARDELLARPPGLPWKGGQA